MTGVPEKLRNSLSLEQVCCAFNEIHGTEFRVDERNQGFLTQSPKEPVFEKFGHDGSESSFVTIQRSDGQKVDLDIDCVYGGTVYFGDEEVETPKQLQEFLNNFLDG